MDIEGSTAIILSRADLQGEDVSELSAMSREGNLFAFPKKNLFFSLERALVPPKLSRALGLVIRLGLSSDSCKRQASSSRKDLARGATIRALRRNCAL